MAKLIEHWHLRPKGARLIWMRRVRRLCLRPWYWRMTLLFWFQQIPKTKNKSRDLEGARWTRVRRKKRLGRGRGPFRAKNFFQYIPCPFRKINLVLKNVRFNLSNFLHAALNWRDDDNLLVPLFHGFIFKTIFPTFSTFLS